MATTTMTRGKATRRPVVRLSWRRVFIRTVAIAACLAAIVGLFASVRAYRQVDRAQAAAQAQLRETSATFRQMAASLRTVADSADHAATTTDGAKGTLGTASTTTRNAANTLDDTAGAINFT